MRELAARLGVSAMTAYRYFKDKDEILAEIRVRAFARLADVLEAANRASGSTGVRCAAVSRAYVEFASQEPIYYRLMFEASQRPAEPSPQSRDGEARIRTVLASLVHKAGEGSAELVARQLWSTLHGIVMLRLADKLSDADVEKSLAETLRLLGTGYDELADARAHLPPLRQRPQAAETYGADSLRHGGNITLSAAS